MPPSRAVEGTGKHPPPDFSLFLLFSSPLPRAFLPLPCAYNVPIPAGSTQPESITPRGTLLETRALSPAGRPSSPSSSSSQWPHTPLLIPPVGVGSTWGGGFMPPHQLQFCNRAVDSLCCCCMNRVCRVSAPAAVCRGGPWSGEGLQQRSCFPTPCLSFPYGPGGESTFLLYSLHRGQGGTLLCRDKILPGVFLWDSWVSGNTGMAVS